MPRKVCFLHYRGPLISCGVRFAPRGGQSEGRHPLVTRFIHGALRLRTPASEAYAKWWIRMLFHSLKSSYLPSPWGSRLTLQKFAFGTQTSVGISFLKCSMQLEFLKRNVSGYVCNPSTSRGRDAASRATLPGSLRALASFLEADAGSTTHAFMLPGLYVTPPVTSCPIIGLITHVIQSVVTLKVFPKHSTQRLIPSRN